MGQQRTWRQRRQDEFQYAALREKFSNLKKQSEDVKYQRFHETAWVESATRRYDAAKAEWDNAVTAWLDYCRSSGCDGNVVEVHHP